ncbi:MAG: hypothetical protein NT016_01220 [Candidatus Aenigmarchaeota archaeon]|nr:hypothetical protein [Candidatus Aenigmarchaeota archaeon]
MKRGRPNKRSSVHMLIMDMLGASGSPMTVSAMTRIVSEKTGQPVSWNTVQKYLQELVETNKVQAMALPHSKDASKTGLVVYTLRR